MYKPRPTLGLLELFLQAYPLAGRAAEVRSASSTDFLREAALDRDDLKQEAFAGIWIALPRFDPARASLGTFVERVVATNIASLFRRIRAKKRAKPPDYDPAGETLHLLVRLELRLDLDRILKKLTTVDRAVLQLLAENSPAAVARILGISRAAVYRSIGRIQKALMAGGFN